MIPDAPEAACESPSANGAPVAANRGDAAWLNFANAMITEAHLLAIAVVDDAAATVRLKVARAITDDTVHQPSSAVALTLGATIGIIGAVLLTPRVIHGRR
jgi:hypothetical protein